MSTKKDATQEQLDPPEVREGNPFNQHTEPQAWQRWNAERGFVEETSDDQRSDLQSAKLEDAGLHPQLGTNVPGLAEVGGIGDSGNRRVTARGRVAKNEHGETPAEEYRRQLAARAPDQKDAPEQVDEPQLTPELSAASSGISQPTKTPLTRGQGGSGAPGKS